MHSEIVTYTLVFDVYVCACPEDEVKIAKTSLCFSLQAWFMEEMILEMKGDAGV